MDEDADALVVVEVAGVAPTTKDLGRTLPLRAMLQRHKDTTLLSTASIPISYSDEQGFVLDLPQDFANEEGVTKRILSGYENCHSGVRGRTAPYDLTFGPPNGVLS